MYEVKSGVIPKAQKVILYGPEGIGKSSLAAQFPNPVFIDTEGSTDKLEVNRLKKPTSWTELLQMLDWIKQQRQFSTVIIDTADWAQRLAEQEVNQQYGVQSIADIGYGNGYVYMKDKFGNFLDKMQDMADAGINAVLTAHAQIVKFEDPGELGAYDRYELKLAKRSNADVSAMAKEWADTILFMNYKVISVKADDSGKKYKAQGGQRVMYTTHRPAWDAKNRDNLSEELPLDYSSIAHIIPDMLQSATPTQPVTETPVTNAKVDESGFEVNQEPMTPAQQEVLKNMKLNEVIPQALRDLMTANNVTEDEILAIAAYKGFFPIGTDISVLAESGFLDGAVIPKWDNFMTYLQEVRADPSIVEQLLSINGMEPEVMDSMDIHWINQN